MTDERSAETAAELDELQLRLRSYGSFTTEYAANDAIASLRKQLDEAREREAQMAAALREIAEGGPDRKPAIPFRADGVRSKNDKCAHNKPMWDDCVYCTMEFARAALSQEPPAPHDHTPDPQGGLAGVLRDAGATIHKPASPSPVLRDAVMVPRELTDEIGSVLASFYRSGLELHSFDECWADILTAAGDRT